MHVPYQQKIVQDTGTSSARNTYFDNIHGGPQKSNLLPHYQKNCTISRQPAMQQSAGADERNSSDSLEDRYAGAQLNDLFQV